MMKRADLLVLAVAAAMAASAGCTASQNSNRAEYEMGERATVGPLTYNVIETTWRSQLGTDFKLRVPQQRFLVLTISVTNGGGKSISVPLFSLENQQGESFRESDNGEGVDNWFGLLRELNPAQTEQGRLVFDVPLGSYKLRVTDGGEPGAEKYVSINIPLRMDTDTGVDSPVIGDPGKPPANPGAIK